MLLHPLFLISRLSVLTLLLACAGTVAADDKTAAAREREQLQRTRAALREATAQRDALQAEKLAWEGERRELAARSARATSSGQAAATRIQQELQQQLQALQDDMLHLEVLAAAWEDAQRETAQQARENEARLRQQLALTQRELAERTATVRAVAQLLERSAGALGNTQAANQQMHAAGLKAIEQLRQEMGPREISITDPLGLRAVRRENTTDALKDALEQPRVKAAR